MGKSGNCGGVTRLQDAAEQFAADDIAIARDRTPLLREIHDDEEAVKALKILLGVVAPLWLGYIREAAVESTGRCIRRGLYDVERVNCAKLWKLCSLLEAAVVMQDDVTEAAVLAQTADACASLILTEAPPAAGPLADAAALFGGHSCLSPWRNDSAPAAPTGNCSRADQDAHSQSATGTTVKAAAHGRCGTASPIVADGPLPLLEHEALWCRDNSAVSQYLTALGMNGLHPTRMAAVLRRLPLHAAARMPAALLCLCMHARAEYPGPADRPALMLTPQQGLDCDALIRISRLAHALPPVATLVVSTPDLLIGFEAGGAAAEASVREHSLQQHGEQAAMQCAAASAAIAELGNCLAPALTRLELWNLQALLHCKVTLGQIDIPWKRLCTLRTLVLAMLPKDRPFYTSYKADLMPILTHLPNTLEDLTVSCVDLGYSRWDFWQCMGRMHALRRLCLCSCGVTLLPPYGPVWPLPPSELPALHRLEHLDISEAHGTVVSRCECDVLLPQIMRFPLTALVLAGTDMLRVLAARLVGVLASMPTLRLLDVSDTMCPHVFLPLQGPLALNGWGAFAAHAGRLTQLRHLRMNRVQVGRASWPKLLSGLRGLCGLQTLEAAQCRGLGDSMWPQVVQLVHSLPQLETVDLSHNEFSFNRASLGAAAEGAWSPNQDTPGVISGDVMHVAHACESHLQHDEAVPSKSCLKLRHINLSWCRVSNTRNAEEEYCMRAAHVLCAELLTRAPELESVDLRYNWFQGASEEVIRGALQARAPQLRDLRISDS